MRESVNAQPAPAIHQPSIETLNQTAFPPIQPEFGSRKQPGCPGRGGSAAFTPQKAGKNECLGAAGRPRTFLQHECRAPRLRLPFGFGIRVILAAALGVAMLQVARAADEFVLREHLGRGWTNEMVTFPLSAAQAGQFKASPRFTGPSGETVAGQVFEADGKPRLALQVTLSPGARQGYRLSNQGTPPASDLKVEDSKDGMRLGNSLVGIALRKKLQGKEAPISGIRLRSGKWTTGATLEGAAEVTGYRVELTARGPVFAEAVCHITFADQGTWKLTLRVMNREPVILVEESLDAPAGGTLRLPLGGDAFRPSHLLHRHGMNQLGKVDSWQIAPGQAFALEPWLRWFVNVRQGNWFALYTPGAAAPGSQDGDLLMVGALRPSLWRDPDWKGKAPQLSPLVPAMAEAGMVSLQLPLGGGARRWMLGTPPLAESVAPLAAKDVRVAPLPQKYLIKHGDFPLDEVKDYVLEWPGDVSNYPRLFVGKQDLPALRSGLKNDPAQVRRWVSDQPIDKYNIEAPLLAYFASQDPALGRALAQKSREWLQQIVDKDLLEQDSRVTLGVAPHMLSVLLLPTINLTDAVLGSDVLTPEQRQRTFAQLAFLGYTVTRDDYWSPARGFAANPNMTTTVALYQTALASLIPSHPQAKSWAERGLRELQHQLQAWSDEDGGWLEAPHYAMVALDHMLGAFLVASRAGFGDHVHDLRARKAIEWLAKISTPRDRRTGGFRHYPPIGNTYMGEGTGMFGIVAGLWKQRDPEFAAQMQWMCDEHGSPAIGLFGPFGTFAGYQGLLKSHGVAPKAPAYGSEWFRNTGVVLRNSYGTERETYLHLIAGSNHDHYDHDSGSIVLWGKGRLLADDFGYIGRHAAQWHSQVTSPALGTDALMRIEAFAPASALDYVAGRKGVWRRQIALVKDADPLGPNFFLLRDTHDAPEPATWRLWLTTKGIVLHERGATVEGEDDVDLDVFLHEPRRLATATESTVQKGMGRRDGKEGPTETRQTALVATLPSRGTLTALLYPRLKQEPPPTVTWFADGRIAAVKSPAGTDYVLVAPDAPPQPVGDGKTLKPLRDLSTKDGITILSMSGDPQLTLTVNPTKNALVDRTLVVPAGSIALHPGPTNPVTAVWQSPVAGTVNVEVRLRDGNNGGGNGILAELRHGATVLARGALDNGGTNLVLRAENATVAKGDLLRLVVLPGEGENANWWDTTLAEMVVKDRAGKQWDLRESLLRGEPLGNQLARGWDKATWWICSGDAQKFDPKALPPPAPETFATPDGNVSFQGTAGAIRVRGGKQATLTLAAPGQARIGKVTLESSKPASRSETLR